MKSDVINFEPMKMNFFTNVKEEEVNMELYIKYIKYIRPLYPDQQQKNYLPLYSSTPIANNFYTNNYTTPITNFNPISIQPENEYEILDNEKYPMTIWDTILHVIMDLAEFDIVIHPSDELLFLSKIEIMQDGITIGEFKLKRNHWDVTFKGKKFMLNSNELILFLIAHNFFLSLVNTD